VTIVRIGATQKYSDNWEVAFGKKGGRKAAAAKSTKKAVSRKAAKKKTKRR
jgi:hypothetical protein